MITDNLGDVVKRKVRRYKIKFQHTNRNANKKDCIGYNISCYYFDVLCSIAPLYVGGLIFLARNFLGHGLMFSNVHHAGKKKEANTRDRHKLLHYA